MALKSGDKLGPYQIVSEIGAGGMGVVYRAHDSRVGRDVAIKTSNAQFSDRFEREARAIAALNHPHICTLYDVGPDYLVMELVDGTSPRGPLPVKTVLEYGSQIADALDAAHQRGIVHRDLKPANIKVRSDGTVKVLDFGLAKIDSESADGANVSNSPTRMDQTHAGAILGTAPYMSPEQARGKPVDKRTDIWAFGAVLYELLTGRRAFEGDDVATILTSVLERTPRWDDVSPDVRPLIESCLQKDPQKRLRDIGDVWALINRPSTSTTGRSASTIGWIVAAAFAALAAIALWAPWRRAPAGAPSSPAARFDVDLGQDVSLDSLYPPTFSSLIISPDSRRLIFPGSVANGSTKLLSRRLDEPSVSEIANTEGASNPIFSPDGRWIAYWTGTTLQKISVDGGVPVPLADIGNVMTGGTWNDAGHLVVGSGLPKTTGLVRVPADGGPPETIATLGSDELFFATPRVLPGARALLFAVIKNPPVAGNTTIDVLTLADKRRTTLVRGGASPRYVPTGHLLYAKGRTLFAIPFDLERLETRGTPVQLLEDLAIDTVAGEPQFDLSPTGILVYRKSAGTAVPDRRQLQWLDGSGARKPAFATTGAYVGAPRLSPDGRYVAVTIRDGNNQDIWVYDVQRETPLRLTFGGGSFGSPVWTPDGRHLVFSSLAKGIFWTRADGTGQPQALVTANTLQLPMSFTRDGTRLVFEQIDGIPQIWSVDVTTSASGPTAGTPTRFLTSPFVNDSASISPDGRWVVYQSNESGKFEIYVRAFGASSSAADTKIPISTGGGVLPAWSPRATELFYLSENQMMVVTYHVNGETFAADKPRAWAAVADVSGFDMAPDGKRVVVNVPAVARSGSSQEHTIVFVQNFFDELHQRVPVPR